MRVFAWVVLGLTVVLFGVWVFGAVHANYEYEQTIGSFWELSDRASALDLKADYLDKYVAALDSAHLSGHDAIIFPTPQNDVGQNLTALRSLQTRMHEIRTMDVQSFAYQQAISQITAQEQGQAQPMLDVLEGRWYLDHHPLYWGWICGIVVFLFIGGALGGIILLANADD